VIVNEVGQLSVKTLEPVYEELLERTRAADALNIDEPTNNAAERGLRAAVIYRTGLSSTRADQGLLEPATVQVWPLSVLRRRRNSFARVGSRPAQPAA
jgi:hypothetical protein